MPSSSRAIATLGDRARGRDNAFDLLRLLAATLVLVSHSFALAGHREPHLGHSSLGVIGVEIFFAISGFLVTKSWLSQPRARAFLAKRALRILPALIVTVVLTAVVAGPLWTSLSTSQYARNHGAASYVLDNVGAVASGGTARHVAYQLPGVFQANPTDAVNGSLWTLPVEVRAYLLVLALGLLGLLTRMLWVVVAGGLALLALPSSAAGWSGVGSLLSFIRDGQPESLLLLVIFCVSGLLYLQRDRIPLRAPLLLGALAAWAIFTRTTVGAPLVAISVSYAVLFAGHRAPGRLAALTRRGDVSYGLYLLAFPVQQMTVAAAGGSIAPLALLAVSLPATYVLAMLSWRLVERPALRLKGAIGAGRSAAPRVQGEAAAAPVTT